MRAMCGVHPKVGNKAMALLLSMGLYDQWISLLWLTVCMGIAMFSEG